MTNRLRPCSKAKIDFNRLKILIIDDHAFSRSIVKSILTGLHISNVKEAESPVTALEILKEQAIDICLVDLKTGPTNGIEFTKRLRASPNAINNYLPVIMISGHTDHATVAGARDAGVNEYLVKPLTAKALIDRIERVIATPRPFIRSASYFGPDRRHRLRGDYYGECRRKDVSNVVVLEV